MSLGFRQLATLIGNVDASALLRVSKVSRSDTAEVLFPAHQDSDVHAVYRGVLLRQ